MKFTLKFSIFFFALFSQLSSYAQTYPQWAKSYGVNSEYTDLTSNCLDADGNTYMLLNTSSTVFQNIQLNTNGEINTFIIKLDVNGSYLWHRQLHSHRKNFGKSIATTGNQLVICGNYDEFLSLSFPNLASPFILQESLDYLEASFVIKLTTDGDFLWAKRMGSIQVGENQDIEQVAISSDAIYAAGQFEGTINFNTPSATGSNELTSLSEDPDCFLAKYDLSGNVIWIKRFGSSESDFLNELAVSDNQVAVCGRFVGLIDFNTPSSISTNTLASAGGSSDTDWYVALFNTDGTLSWIKRLGSTYIQYGTVKVLFKEQELLLGGEFSGSVNFSSPYILGQNEINSSDASDIFLAKYDLTGNLKFTNVYGGIDNQFLSEMAISDDIIYMYGHYKNEINFDNSTNLSSKKFEPDSLSDNFIALLNDEGNLIDFYRIGGKGNESALEFTSNESGLFLSGSFSEKINFNTPSEEGLNELLPKNKNDKFYAKFENNKLSFNWQEALGSKNTPNEFATDIASDEYGNKYVCGYFKDTLVVTNSTVFIPSKGGSDIFIAKYNPTGELVWLQRAGGNGNEEVNGIAVRDNKIVITGSFTNTANFSTPYQSGVNEVVSLDGKDIFIACFDYQGQVKWAKRAGGYYHDIGWGVALENGNLYITGEYDIAANFNTPSNISTNFLTSIQGVDAFIAKYDTTGALIWYKNMGGDGIQVGKRISVEGDFFAVGGNFEQIIKFGISGPAGTIQITDAGGEDAFYAKYSTITGNAYLAGRGGGVGNDNLNDILIRNGSIYLTGSFRNLANFNNPSFGIGNTLFATGDSEGYLVKVNNGGGIAWLKKTNGSQNDGGQRLAFHKNRIALSGYFEGTLTPGIFAINHLTSAGGYDGFVAIYDTLGNIKNTRRLGGVSDDQATGITFDGHQAVLCGNFQSTANFNTPSLSGSKEITAKSGFDAFVASVVYKYEPKFFDNIQPASTGRLELSDSDADSNGNIYSLFTYLNNPILESETLPIPTISYGLALTKNNKNGDKVWVKPLTLKGNVDNFINGQPKIEVGSDGIYISGMFNDTLTFLNSSVTLNSYPLIGEIFLAKFNFDGVLIWAKRMGGNQSDFFRGFTLFNDEIFVSGFFRDSLNFNQPSNFASNKLVSGGNSDYFICKYNSSGAILWYKRFGNPSYNSFLRSFEMKANTNQVCLSFDADNLINFSNPYQNGISEVQLNSTSICLACFQNIDGSFMFAKQVGGEEVGISSLNETQSPRKNAKTTENSENDVKVTALSLDNTGIYLAANYTGTINFNNPSSPGSNELTTPTVSNFIAKYSQTGSLEWYKSVFNQDFSGSIQELIYDDSGIWAFIDPVGYIGTDLRMGSIPNNFFGPNILKIAKINTLGTVTKYQSQNTDSLYIGVQSARIKNGKVLLNGRLNAANQYSFGANNSVFIPNRSFDSYMAILDLCDVNVVLISPGDDYSNKNFSHFAPGIAGGFINASNKITGTSAVNYSAASVMLNPGFKADTGTIFKAETGGCN